VQVYWLNFLVLPALVRQNQVWSQQSVLQTYFGLGLAAGYLNIATATFNNILPDAPVATLEMVAWDKQAAVTIRRGLKPLALWLLTSSWAVALYIHD